MPAFRDLSGQTFGQLTVVQRAGTTRGNALFLCRCTCGGLAEVPGNRLTSGNTKSCGCRKRDRLLRHNLSRHPLYKTWRAMTDRCTNPGNKQWPDYGGRGITIADDWLGEIGLARFIEDMGERPAGCSLDRINNHGPYSKANCRWATDTQQQRNTRQNIMLTHNGRTACVSEWAALLLLRNDTIFYRLKQGMPMHRVLSPDKLTRSAR